MLGSRFDLCRASLARQIAANTAALALKGRDFSPAVRRPHSSGFSH
jgi:hypothetical protein